LDRHLHVPLASEQLDYVALPWRTWAKLTRFIATMRPAAIVRPTPKSRTTSDHPCASAASMMLAARPRAPGGCCSGGERHRRRNAVGGIGCTAPAANAYPGGPAARCETQVFAMYCDGPIRPDATFQRCTTTFAQSAGPGGIVPPTYMCRIIDNNAPFPPIPLGQPPHHIDP
jgi:hypothetical protein